MLYLARLLIAYPIGWAMDTFGRKAGLMLGLVLSLIGAVGIGLAMLWASFLLFVASLLVFGMGVGAGQQLRTAAADMYLPERRAEGLGYVPTGALVGALGGPLLVAAAQVGSAPLRLEPNALAWLLVPAVLVPRMALVLLIRPDPKTIAANLSAITRTTSHPQSTARSSVSVSVSRGCRSCAGLLAPHRYHHCCSTRRVGACICWNNSPGKT